jgi:hypothetical protein
MARMLGLDTTAKGPILDRDGSQRDGLEGFAPPRSSASQAER